MRLAQSAARAADGLWKPETQEVVTARLYSDEKSRADALAPGPRPASFAGTIGDTEGAASHGCA